MIDPKRLAKEFRASNDLLGEKLIEALKSVWPEDVDIQLMVVVRKGKFKIHINPPQVKEPGWVDG